MAKKEEKKETIEIPTIESEPFDDLWALMLLSLLFWQPIKPDKIINIYMGDD